MVVAGGLVAVAVVAGAWWRCWPATIYSEVVLARMSLNMV
jgi:hypothetical protein